MGEKKGSQPNTHSDLSPCTSKGCKTKPAKFGFCLPHFEHFKFGLITKHGEQVPDYDKKFDAFARLKGKLKAA